jgi:hypothetical protein
MSSVFFLGDQQLPRVLLGKGPLRDGIEFGLIIPDFLITRLNISPPSSFAWRRFYFLTRR